MEIEDEVLIKGCVNSLYKAISCEPNTEPNYDDLRELFVDNAIMAEYECINSNVPNIKTIDEHISEIKTLFKKYSFVSKNGFLEKQLSIKIMMNGPVATVYSEYEKSYFNGKEDIKNTGCNILQIVKIDGNYKIISVSWFEN
ncbi:MAG: hypothetical protein PHE93_04745 [Clostridia bacterium]|nr:hypothetical protein [Clostridia bacterium]